MIYLKIDSSFVFLQFHSADIPEHIVWLKNAATGLSLFMLIALDKFDRILCTFSKIFSILTDRKRMDKNVDKYSIRLYTVKRMYSASYYFNKHCNNVCFRCYSISITASKYAIIFT